MDQQAQNRPNPRRRRRSKLQIFKEAYLPVIILALTVILVIVFIVGSLSRGKAPDNTGTSGTDMPAASSSEDNRQDDAIQAQIQQLLKQAEEKARIYDYAGAMAILDSFAGDKNLYPQLTAAYDAYEAAEADLVTWSASQVPNLSFHLLIADPQRAYADKTYGSSYRKNFITTTEFTAILQQLYENGYILVDLEDLYVSTFSDSAGREVFQEATLRLPSGKKPIMLTEVNANYYTYMIDGNGDKKPDAKGSGFASRLCHSTDKGFYNEIVHADGSTDTGAYDMVPILEDFIALNPDFSYRGARATIAFTGYDGILGYRINSSTLGAAALEQEKADAARVTQALRAAGYTLACYTYNNLDYGTSPATTIQTDIQKWTDEIAPVIGALDVMVFARDSDIGNTAPYEGSKFTLLHNAGFRYFMGVSSAPWNQMEDLYVRHDRLMLTGDNLTKRPQLFEGMFDVESILDPARK